MQDKPENQGLCSTCIHAETCVRFKHMQEPVWYCEEFDDNIPSQPAENQTKTKDFDISQATENAPLYMGLCANCRNRDTCTFPKPEGGIWHCEEYS
jgi:hypothetical protein